MSNGQMDEPMRATSSTNPNGRSSEEIEQGIRETRMQLDNTLEAIQNRFSPGGLADEAVRYLRESGANEFAHNFNESVKSNPIPVALMGVSLAWLMWSGRDGRHESSRIDSADAMRHRLGEAGDNVREQAERVREGARERAVRVREGTMQSVEQARDGLGTLLYEQPLLIGALGVAAGAALGAMLPATRQEDEVMGEASDQLGESVKQQMHLQLRKGKRAAEAAGDAVREEVQSGEYQPPGRVDGAGSEDVYPAPE